MFALFLHTCFSSVQVPQVFKGWGAAKQNVLFYFLNWVTKSTFCFATPQLWISNLFESTVYFAEIGGKTCIFDKYWNKALIN